MKKNRLPQVSIIIPCYNEERTIRKLLQAIHDQTYPVEQMEVIIADALSIDKTRERINEFIKEHPDLSIKLVENPQKKIPTAINLAVGEASGEIIVRLDAHSIPDSKYVQLCTEAIQADKGDCVGGVWEILPGAEGWVARSISYAAAHPLGVGDALYRFTNKSGEVDTVPFGSFRKSLFIKLGGFSEELLTNEDYEFYTRIRKQGGKIWLDPTIRCRYFARSSFSELVRQYWRYGFWKFRMLSKYPETLRWRQALPPLFVLVLFISLLASLFCKSCRFFLFWMILIYVCVLFLASITSAKKKNDFVLVVGLPLAIATMHISWGTGFLYSMITKNFWKKK